MFIRRQRKSTRGFTLVEVMIASGVFGIASLALCSLYLFSLMSFSNLANYADLDRINRGAVDRLTKEIRQARQLVDVQEKDGVIVSITIINGDDQSVTYTFNEATHQLTRAVSGGASEALISDCSLLEFHLNQRNPQDGTFNQYPVATSNWSEEVKVIRLTWKAKRQTSICPVTSENVQTAQIVIRKQH
jgi:prepilin-type N-terminal cleavage/methylation domain-containing protein